MNEHLDLIIPLLAGFALDCLLGDPHSLPHPIRWFGKAISVGEAKLNRGLNRKIKGALLAFCLIFTTYFVFKLGLTILSAYQNLYFVVSSILVFYGLANRSLIQEALRVILKLEKEGLEAGRQQLSMIVGRETSQLNENQIRTAVLETLAENLSDGVIAPLFFYFIGGVPAMLAYKMANTLDSMIGYKNMRYKDFGFFAAKLDDVLNFIPARLTAILMAVVSFSFRAIRFIYKYGRKHSSPNAGYPEAALAGILNCRFGGPNRYHGKLVEKPFIGENPRPVSANDVYKACLINGTVSLVFIGVFILWLV
ncbi:adenosylcobinamide-phosphate synthase CbiB [uncultured Draconibacterium sp.]|uniref:adenosylcobinamide-phosphate synthase CbiB n=1 Tax=uncultured Draconibacterium sp. TaxID=1573823 RepID=UPI0029C8532B|nr:adenosylcobinamide-phosphate synthase CbiB [uncultured Draconibacterium sp.]